MDRMSQIPHRRINAAGLTLVSLAIAPLFLVGCSGGNNGAGFGTTPTPTAAPTPRPAAPGLNAIFSQPSSATPLPPDTTYTPTSGIIYTQSGYNALQLSFGQSEVIIGISTLGTIKSGDTFTFSPSFTGLGDKNISFNYSLNFTRPTGGGSLSGQSGTLRVDSLTNQPATAGNRATATLKFTLTNVVFKDLLLSSTLTLNGTGQAVLQNFGALGG